MENLGKRLVSLYNFLTEDTIDQRTKDLFLVAKPVQLLLTIGLYQLFVLRWGPQFMKNRQPFNIKKVVIAFDLLQIICCGYLFCTAAFHWATKFQFICEPIDYSNSEDALKVVRLFYFYFLLKVSDLLDTVFFVLRKKTSHVSFLHVFHHSIMVFATWVSVTYIPGGHAGMIGITNSFVHVIMYSYYLATLTMPEVKKHLWLKKFVTQIQILQFLFNVLHTGSILVTPNCNYPKWVALVCLPNNLFMLILFLDFYIQNYIKKPRVKSESKQIAEIETEKDTVKNKCV